MKDMHNGLKVVQMLDPQKLTTTTLSGKADLLGYEGAEVVLSVGVDGDTLSGSVKWTPELQESNDDTTYTAVAAADIIGSFSVIDDAATKDSQAYKVGYIGSKRYLKVNNAAAGTHTNGCIFGVHAILGFARHNPVS